MRRRPGSFLASSGHVLTFGDDRQRDVYRADVTPFAPPVRSIHETGG